MRRSILTLVLCTLCLCPLFSQEAFYIYRNDGDFNGFFFDEVVEMRYSKLALDSVEYEQYVTYEVELADTVYRIPLAAIDSIGFQQPEIIFNENLRHMDLLEMTPYVLARDGQTLTFSSQIPDSLMPQIGDVLVGFTGIFEDEGFGGRALSVTNTDDGIVVETEVLTQLSDVFVQFISIEQVGINPEDPQQAYHRIAGMNKIKQLNGGINASLLNINVNLHVPFVFNQVSSASIDASVGLTLKMTAVFSVTTSSLFFRFQETEEYNCSSGVTLKFVKGTGDTEAKKEPLISEPFGSFKFPYPTPLFEISPAPWLGFRAGGSIDAKVTLPSITGRKSSTWIFDTDAPDLVKYTTKDFPAEPQTTGFFDALSNSDVELHFQGFVQAGIMLRFALQTNSWFSKIAQAGSGVDIWLAPKLQGSLDISGKALLEGDGPYSMCDSKASISLLSLDAEIYSEFSWLGNKLRKVWMDGSIDLLPRLDLYLLPKFISFDVAYSTNAQIIDAEWYAEDRITFMSGEFGIVLFQHDMGGNPVMVDSDYKGFEVLKSPIAHFDMRKRTVNMKAGPYFAAPSFKIFNDEYPVYSMQKQVIVPLKATADVDSLSFDVTGEPSTAISISTNCPKHGILIDPGYFNGDSLIRTSLSVVDSAGGTYQLICSALPNDRIFCDTVIEMPRDSADCPKIRFITGAAETDSVIRLGFYQEMNDLSDVHVHISGTFGTSQGTCNLTLDERVNAERLSNDQVRMFWTDSTYSGGNLTVKKLEIILTRVDDDDHTIRQGEIFKVSGGFQEQVFSPELGYVAGKMVTFASAVGIKKSFSTNNGKNVDGAYTWTDYDAEDGPMTYSVPKSSGGYVHGSITVNIQTPDE